MAARCSVGLIGRRLYAGVGGEERKTFRKKLGETKAYTSTNSTELAAAALRDRKTLGATTEVLENGSDLFAAK